MSVPSSIHNKSYTLLMLAAHSYEPNPINAQEQAQLRRGFEAMVEELRRVESIAAAGIDQFIAQATAAASEEDLLPAAVMLASALPDAAYYAALASAGFTEEDPPVDPHFLQAASRLMELNEKHGAHMRQLPEYGPLYQRMIKHAPPSIQQYAAQREREMGLLLQASHVDAQGRPVFTIEQVAEVIGVPADALQRLAEEHTDELNEMVAIEGFHAGPAFPVQ